MARPPPRQSLQDTGKYCLALAVVALLGYFFVRAEFLAVLGCLLLALIVSCLWMGRACLSGLRAGIEIEGSPVLCGEPAKTILRLENRNRLLPVFHPIMEIRESGRSRSQTYHYTGLLKAGEVIERSIYPTLNQRGSQRLTLANAYTRFPLAIAQTNAPLAVHSANVIVWPRRAQSALPGAPRPSRMETGHSHGQRSHANSILDAYLIRDYQTGDPTRSISWKLSAKLDKLMVLQPNLHPEPEYILILDTLASLWLPVSYYERMLALVSGMIYTMSARHNLSGIILNGKRFNLKSSRGFIDFMDEVSLSGPSEGREEFQPRDRRHYLRIVPDGKRGIALACNNLP